MSIERRRTPTRPASLLQNHSGHLLDNTPGQSTARRERGQLVFAEQHLHWQAFVVFRWNTNEAPELRFDRASSDMRHKGIEYVIS